MAEKIMDFYKGTDKYSDGEIENEILEYLKTTPESELEMIFEKDSRWPVFYHLSPIRQNLVNWYNIEKDASVLEIGAGMGAITGVLCKKAKSVTAVELSNRRAEAIYERHKHYDNLKIIVGNFNDIKFQEKFDYITLIGVLEYAKMFTQSSDPYQEFINKIKKLLKPGGKLLIAIENKYGLKYFCGASEDHTGAPFDSLNDYKNNSDIRTFDKHSLESLLKNAGLKNTRFYYPEPDYKLPNYIFTDKSLPSSNITSKINHYYQPGSFLVADEKAILDDVLSNGVYDFFANSFLIEASELEIDESKNPNFVVFNNERKPEYRLITAVYDDIVYKIPQSKKAVPHFYTIIENTKELKSRGIKVVENKLEDGKISLPFVKEKTLDKIIIDLILDDQIDKAKEIVAKFNKEILKSSDYTNHNILLENKIIDENDKTDFGPILKKGYVDMTFFNCFYIDDEFVFMDQEWVQYDVPVKHIMARSWYNIHSFCEKLKRKYDLDTLLSIFNLDKQITDFMRSIEKNISDMVYDFSTVCPFKSYLSLNGKSKQDYENKILREKNQLVTSLSELNQAKIDLEQQNQELNQAKINLEQQNQELNQAKINLEQQNQELNQAKINLEQQNQELNQAKINLESQSLLFQGLYNETINSACWKVMSPVRVVLNIIKRILKSNKLTLMFYKFLLYVKQYGFQQTLSFIKSKLREKKTMVCTAENTIQSVADVVLECKQNSISDYILQHSRQYQGIDAFIVEKKLKRINIVVDSLDQHSLFGGVATELIIVTKLAGLCNLPLRIITRTTPPNPNGYKNILDLNNIDYPSSVSFFSDYNRNLYGKTRYKLDISSEDIFFATSWWSAKAIRNTIGDSKKIYYILQEAETFFYPYGTDHYLCSTVMEDKNIFYIVNSKFLFEYFEKYNSNIATHGIYFEPAFSKALFSRSDFYLAEKHKLFFYARPNNNRNLFLYGLKLINYCVINYIINTDIWDIYFVGQDVPCLKFDNGYKAISLGILSWKEYSDFLKTVDLAICLMYTPHPSYPPYDVACSGGVVVSNKMLNKQSFDYCDNVILADLNFKDMIKAIERGIVLSQDLKQRKNNYKKSKICRSWDVSLNRVLDILEKDINL